MLKIEVKRTAGNTETAEPVGEFSFQASTLVLLLIFLPIAILLLIPKPLIQNINVNSSSASGVKENPNGQDRTQEHLENV
ncbi:MULTISPECIES: hypothetical protein [Bhargavaea]|uniref:Uncharacterized protein n=1 Tax=Bhargavaea changchunensis TaxID=2134037 RepID=A0ABW2NH75_9BACL|nr:hypothetical protein [Bhargavaea sp. CC-171006]